MFSNNDLLFLITVGGIELMEERNNMQKKKSEVHYAFLLPHRV